MSTATRQVRRRSTASSTGTVPRRAVPRWAVGVAGLLGAVVLAAIVLVTVGREGSSPASAAAPPPSSAAVAEIDSHQIPVREFALYLAQDRAATFAYFQQTYGVADGPHFWTTAHGGQTPADHLKKLALADVTRATVVLDLAQRNQLIPDAGYDAFLTAWTAENARRLKAVAAHQVIYGPVQYTEANYFSYVLNGVSAALPEKLAASGAVPASDDALNAYYQSHLDSYRQQDPGTHTLTQLPFSQAASQVRQDYLHDQFQTVVSGLARSASVHIDTDVLNAVAVN
ncbi:hypothetical protein [Kitasatospora azatica]|uniref:hypothetical protein n=1 Tax=Kitasatospora azatica TaxID=58347 RepID=UPI00055B9AC5|nr:hypothetical protein [Kitasatospora azatica]